MIMIFGEITTSTTVNYEQVIRDTIKDIGYASDETETLMPLTHDLATNIGSKLTEVRKNGTLDWVRPDGKTQVTCEYKLVDGVPVPQRVHTVVIP